MTCAAILSLEEFRAAQQRTEVRQCLHDRFDRGLQRVVDQVKAPTPALEELTPAVFTLLQPLTQAVTEDLVDYAPRWSSAPRSTPPCGPTLAAHSPQERTVETLVGATWRRRPYVYGAHCQVGSAPLDAALGLTARRKQPDVQMAAVKLTKEVPYETACALFEELTGVPLSAHTPVLVPASRSAPWRSPSPQPAARQGSQGPYRPPPDQPWRRFRLR